VRRSMKPSQSDHGRFAAGLFAATVVLTGGGGICLMIALVFAKDVWQPLAVILCALGALVVMLWLMLERPTRRAKDSNIYTAQKESLSEYVESFQPRHRRREGRSFGTNAPPSAEGLRKIREDSNAWCPSDRRVEEYRKSLGEAESL
jgi:hypothetical protein